VVVNCAADRLFALQHRHVDGAPGLPSAGGRDFVPPSVERSTYVLFAKLRAADPVLAGQPIRPPVWTVPNPTAASVLDASSAGLGRAGARGDVGLLSHFERSGLSQVFRAPVGQTAAGREIPRSVALPACRHPIYLGVLPGRLGHVNDERWPSLFRGDDHRATS